MPKTSPTEHQIQAAFFSRLALSWHRDLPVFAIPNESEGQGRTAMIRGARRKAEGRRAGVPDVLVAVAEGGWHGLFLEAKTPTGSLSVHQRKWLTDLANEGYAVAVCRSTDELWSAFERYLKGDWTHEDQWTPGRKRLPKSP
jgi:hypothetical protein